jgi:hypothetical protein
MKPFQFKDIPKKLCFSCYYYYSSDWRNGGPYDIFDKNGYCEYMFFTNVGFVSSHRAYQKDPKKLVPLDSDNYFAESMTWGNK